MQAFEMACRTLLAERTGEHRLASSEPGGVTDLLEASGRLCAVQLLTGAAGLARPGAESDPNFLTLDRLPGSGREILRLSLNSRLFEYRAACRTIPVHRQVAEFLAARYLATLVRKGLLVDPRRLALSVLTTVPRWPNAWPGARPPADPPPRWLAWTLTHRPEIAADVLVRSVLAQLRKAANAPPGSRDLAHSPDHAGVARLAAIPLLRQFPVRSASGQLSCLDRLLFAAWRHGDPDALLELIEEKHADPRMNVAQRVHWLLAGLCLAPESYVGRLESCVAGRERRVRFLAAAVPRSFPGAPGLPWRRSAPALRPLILLIGASCRPRSPGGYARLGVPVTLEANATDRVRECIEWLARIPREDASRALALSSDEDLCPGRSLLTAAAWRQAAARREAEFTCGDIDRVLATPAGGAPANVADLAALTLEHLHDTACTLRHGATSDWKQYWNVDRYNRPVTSRPEGACRDALLSDLQSRLRPLGVDTAPERRTTHDGRADIRVSWAGFAVPVEIKRSFHPHPWRAVRSRLMARHAIGPETDGHGICLVMWFGHRNCCRPTPPETGAPVDPVAPVAERLAQVADAAVHRARRD